MSLNASTDHFILSFVMGMTRRRALKVASAMSPYMASRPACRAFSLSSINEATSFMVGGRVEVGDVVLEGEAFDGLAGREFRWGGGLAWRERGRRVVGH